MSKIAIIIHGWPQPVQKDSPLVRLLQSLGYQVIAPYFFESSSKYTISNITQELNKLLKNQKPDLLVGISMGGFIIPFLGKDYPSAKLIFVASGPLFKPKSSLLKMGVKIYETKFGSQFVKLILKVPEGWQRKLYEKINPASPSTSDNGAYQQSVMADFQYIPSLALEKNLQILQFITRVNNTDLLKQLRNSSLIIQSKEDWMMPEELGLNLHDLLSNSNLIVREGHHSNLIDTYALGEIKNFLT